ncbi:MAG: hypothetical protein R3182_02770 [Draconibacterium sp.]|nr:hypothetical protein [Draconibacterium sp.]
MAYKINWEGNNAIITFFDELTIYDIIESTNKTFGDSRFDRSSYQIGDFTKVKKLSIGSKAGITASIFDKSASQWNKKLKLANVTTDPDLIQEIHDYDSEMEESGWETKLFSTLEEAKKWCKSNNTNSNNKNLTVSNGIS